MPATMVCGRKMCIRDRSNTNKLIRQYEYATGLKTGSTSGAKFCLSATARKDGVNMIAVVMAEPDSKTRIKDAIAMLNYGDVYKRQPWKH